MKKTILTILLCGFLLLGMTGCGFKNNNEELEALKEELNSLKQKLEEKNNDESLEEDVEINNLNDLKKMVNDTNKKIEDLSNEKKDLENKVKDLQDTNNSLLKKVTTLESSNKSLQNTIDSLKSNSSSNTGNQYTITKKQLIGTWTAFGDDFVFNESNCDVIENWIIIHNKNYDSSHYYMYKDGKLYITDRGAIYSKK